jgi:hypothetical protein
MLKNSKCCSNNVKSLLKRNLLISSYAVDDIFFFNQVFSGFVDNLFKSPKCFIRVRQIALNWVDKLALKITFQGPHLNDITL